MASQISAGNIYAGQMLWALRSPYWPSIVCASDSGQIRNANDSRTQRVHVRFCASNRKSAWVQLDNVFEFNGYESFMAKKRSMKSKLSEDDFNKGFETTDNETWRRAVVEGTFVLNKELNSRLVTFDTLHLLEGINKELGQIASCIAFDDIEEFAITPTNPEPSSISEPLKRNYPLRSIKVAAELEKFEDTSQSKAPNQKGRRRSEPPPITKQPDKRLGRRSVQVEKLPNKPLSEYSLFEKDLLTYRMTAYPKKKLFQGIRQGNVCKICCMADDVNDDKLVKCSTCGDHFHSNCLNNNNDDSYVRIPEQLEPEQRRRSSIKIRMNIKLYCNECQPTSVCFCCKDGNMSQLEQCSVRSCGRYYHLDCLDIWKQSEIITSNLKCPLHVCHTCFSINSETTVTTKLTFCVKCPTAYHIDSCCLPAGTIILTQQHHICIRHRIEARPTLPSLDWCFRCGKEDNVLVCCGSCPKTYHMTCLNTGDVPDPFLCESCVSGHNPLYGDMVLAKYGNHPWWPAVIVPSFKIPNHMFDIPPNDHEFCVRFFGDHTFGWLGRGSVYSYSKTEATKFKLLNRNSKAHAAFVEAETWFDKIEKYTADKGTRASNLEKNVTQPSRQPPLYIKTKNVSVVAPAKFSKSKDEPCVCTCEPDDDDPCGPTSDCENRQMLIECDPDSCPTGSNCRNQCFKRNTFACVKVVFMGETKGFGLIADEFISAGTLVIEYVGELITKDELTRRKNHIKTQPGLKRLYFMSHTNGLFIDAAKKGNESRFVNHSCSPNCQTQRWTVKQVDRFGYVALKDIEKGTEITTNYEFDVGDIQQQCLCGENNCKGFIGN